MLRVALHSVIHLIFSRIYSLYTNYNGIINSNLRCLLSFFKNIHEIALLCSRLYFINDAHSHNILLWIPWNPFSRKCWAFVWINEWIRMYSIFFLHNKGFGNLSTTQQRHLTSFFSIICSWFTQLIQSICHQNENNAVHNNANCLGNAK